MTSPIKKKNESDIGTNYTRIFKLKGHAPTTNITLFFLLKLITLKGKSISLVEKKSLTISYVSGDTDVSEKKYRKRKIKKS